MLDLHTMPCGQLQSHSTELNNISDPLILIIPSAVSIMLITKLWNTYKRRYSRQSSLVLRYKIILEYAKAISMIKVMIKTGQINRERCSVQSGMDTGLAWGLLTFKFSSEHRRNLFVVTHCVPSKFNTPFAFI